MLKFTGNGSVTTCDGITRRDFLQVGTLGAIGLTLSKFAALQAMGAVAGMTFGGADALRRSPPMHICVM